MSAAAPAVPPRGGVSSSRMVLSEFAYQQLAYWRNPVGAFFTFGMPIMFLLIFGYLDNGGKVPLYLGVGNMSLDQYFVPSILTLGVISACYTYLAVQLATQREQGLLKKVRATPIPAWAYLASLVLSCLARTAVLVAITLGCGAVLYHVQFPSHAAVALTVTIVVAAACFSALGAAITVIIPNEDAAPAVVQGIYLPLMFISGTFFPLGPHSALAQIANYFPVRPFVLATFSAMNPNVHGSGIRWGDIGVMAVWMVAGLIVSVRRFRWVPTRRA
jgi:ABC-2 type transport system permease protein